MDKEYNSMKKTQDKEKEIPACYIGYTQQDRDRMLTYWGITLAELEKMRDGELDSFFR